MIKRVKINDILNINFKQPNEPFILDIKMFDIGNTVICALHSLIESPWLSNAIGISMLDVQPQYIKDKCNLIAKENNFKIIWRKQTRSYLSEMGIL